MMHKNINQLEKAVVQNGESITSLQALRTQFEPFFKSPNVTCTAYRLLHKDFKESTHYDVVEYRRRLLHYLDKLEKLLKEIALKDGTLRLKEKEVKTIKEIVKRLKDKEKQTQESMVVDTILGSQGAALDDSLVIGGTSSAQKNKCSTSGNDSSDSQPSSDTNTTSKILKEEITNLKSQAYNKENTFSSENKKYDEYVQPLLKRKNELEKKNKEFSKQMIYYENRLRKAGPTDQTLCMLLPSEDMVKMGRHGLGFDDYNDVVNPSLLGKAKELVPNLYNADKIGIDLPSDHKIISE
nr:hypothetical protein [Tanacetum cinerariifolium]